MASLRLWLLLLLPLLTAAVPEETAQVVVGKPVGRGEYAVDIARLDERISQIRKEMKRQSATDAEALSLARTEFLRRVSELNHETARILAVNESKVSIDKFEALSTRVLDLELLAKETAGKLYFPMLVIAGLSSAISAALAGVVVSYFRARPTVQQVVKR